MKILKTQNTTAKPFTIQKQLKRTAVKIIYTTFICTTLLGSLAIANPNFVKNTGKHYDQYGDVIMPDKYFLAKALLSYQDGYNESAYKNFKKAAAFGNSVAQKFIGLMHIKAMGVPRSWSEGYAWIRLSALDKNSENVNLRNKIFALMSPEEAAKSELAYQEIKKDYDPLEALKRRDAWVRRQKRDVVGSRVGSRASNVYSFSPNGQLINANSSKSLDQMESFVEDFNYGYVTSGEIIPIEETQEDSPKNTEENK